MNSTYEPTMYWLIAYFPFGFNSNNHFLCFALVFILAFIYSSFIFLCLAALILALLLSR
jgi:hypothetical protein